MVACDGTRPYDPKEGTSNVEPQAWKRALGVYRPKCTRDLSDSVVSCQTSWRKGVLACRPCFIDMDVLFGLFSPTYWHLGVLCGLREPPHITENLPAPS